MSWFKKKQTGPDRDLVEECSAPRERKAPRFFVGREEIIASVEKACRWDRKDIAAGEVVPGLTFLVQGAPGAGKSSLLSHLKSRWIGKDDPVVMSVPEAVLKDPEALVRRIAERVVPSKAKALDRKTVSTTHGGAGGSSPIGVGHSRTRETGSPAATFEILASLKPPGKWKQPLCILVDEIQTVTKEHGICLRQLHLREHGLPIIPIYAGLADSESALMDADLTRLETDNVRTLGALAPGEVHSYVRQMLDHCRIDYTPDQLERLSDGIAKSSEGWPQHVHTDTAALFWGLHRTDCNLAGVDLEAVKDQARTYRETSYRKRRSTRMIDSVHLVAAVMRELPTGGMHRSKVLKSIKDKVEPEEAGWGLPKGMDAEDFRDHLIHRGALQPDENGMLICPIPSLRTWLIAQGSPRQTMPATASSREEKETDVVRTAIRTSDDGIRLRADPQSEKVRRQDPENEDEGR